MKILIATDGSEFSDAAVEKAWDRASLRPRAARLAIVRKSEITQVIRHGSRRCRAT